jgi:arginyl-tRNA synthetase
VKYADLSKNRTSDYVFDWDSMLSFEGNTAPYLMYAYARIKTLLGKQAKQEELETLRLDTSCDLCLEEKTLLVKALQLSEVIDAVGQDGYPNALSNYLYELSAVFMRFYESCPIKGVSDDIRTLRLGLCLLTAESLKAGPRATGHRDTREDVKLAKLDRSNRRLPMPLLRFVRLHSRELQT